MSGGFKNNPPVVILDGYDELLQASGKVFSWYLKEVQNFQKNEAEQGRPVRVIVTSRVTLIDKATIPAGATIVRLLEFDKHQRDRWISIWNGSNANYFIEAKVEEFGLPDENEPGAQKVLSLAEQPLLLLMLALYDSEKNQLRKSKGLDRTKLYDSLLRRFVTREQGKEKAFERADVSEKNKILDVEMHRLGVAALGMYNRRKVHILSSELNDDLKFFGAERSVSVAAGKPLSQADLLLGSFFFVHKSKAQHTAGSLEHHEEASAFEFLHNTFGEFLTADFILRRTLAEVELLKSLQETEVLRGQMEKRLSDADGFQREWFASLVYAPLFTGPVMLEMMREWIPHLLKAKNLSKRAFVSHLDTVILNQIKRLLCKREMPSIIRKETVQEGYRAPFGDHPLLGHIAIYSINLILLRVIVVDEPFVLDESQIGMFEDGARPWDRLIYVWRAWFALDNLNGITALIVARREEYKITIWAKEKFQVAEGRDRLETCLNVAVSLGDNITSGLAGLLLFDASQSNKLELGEIEDRLGSEKIDLQFEIHLKYLSTAIKARNPADFWRTASQLLDAALRRGRNEELGQIALGVSDRVKWAAQAGPWGGGSWQEESEAFRGFVDPSTACEVSLRAPLAATLLYQAAREIGDSPWMYEFEGRLADFAFGRHHPTELLERSPAAMLCWMQVMREIDIKGFRRRVDPQFFESVLHSRMLLELMEENPMAALEWVELARELGGDDVLKRMPLELADRMFRSRQLLALTKWNPAAALRWAQLGREIAGRKFSREIVAELSEQIIRSQQLSELFNRSPEAALAWVALARETGSEELVEHLVSRLLEEAFHPRQIIQLIESNPKIALSWVQLSKEFDAGRLLRHVEQELLERVLDPHKLDRLLRHQPGSFASVLRLCRSLESSRVASALEEYLTPALDSSNDAVALIGNLPLSAFSDLQWLASVSRNRQLEDTLRSLRSLLVPY